LLPERGIVLADAGAHRLEQIEPGQTGGVPVKHQHVDRGTGQRFRHRQTVAEGNAHMAKPFDDFTDDETMLGIGLKNCDAHHNGTGEPANGDFGTYFET